jgi:hypothetical protein
MNSTTRLHLVGSFYVIYIRMYGSMNIKLTSRVVINEASGKWRPVFVKLRNAVLEIHVFDRICMRYSCGEC